jgi:hypothetical protein
MEPVDTGQAGLDRWADQRPRAVVIGGPAEGPDVVPCPAIITEVDGTQVVRVAWQLDEIELAALARGGTLWLSTWGGLPIHLLHVDHAVDAPLVGF